MSTTSDAHPAMDMLAVRLHGARDMRPARVRLPGPPGRGEALIAVRAVGVCGSDLHTYQDGRIGDTTVERPAILGHEFAGRVLAVGEEAVSGLDEPLRVGQRVAVDPEVPCRHCEMCERGDPNLCPNHSFYGLYPTDGALQERMIVDARSCFPVPDAMSDAAAVMLEPLGVAIHALDLGRLRVADSVAVLGCGPIGLLILRLAVLAGARPVYAFDRFPWRVEMARALGATEAWVVPTTDGVAKVAEVTGGRGVDVAFEAAWADASVQQAADMARNGGRVVLVGIPGDDELRLQHSTARRKGLTIRLSRRMKHTYPRALRLAGKGGRQVDLDALVSHRFPLERTPEAFALNAAYAEGVHKILVEVEEGTGASAQDAASRGEGAT